MTEEWQAGRPRNDVSAQVYLYKLFIAQASLTLPHCNALIPSFPPQDDKMCDYVTQLRALHRCRFIPSPTWLPFCELFWHRSCWSLLGLWFPLVRNQKRTSFVAILWFYGILFTCNAIWNEKFKSLLIMLRFALDFMKMMTLKYRCCKFIESNENAAFLD